MRTARLLRVALPGAAVSETAPIEWSASSAEKSLRCVILPLPELRFGASITHLIYLASHITKGATEGRTPHSTFVHLPARVTIGLVLLSSGFRTCGDCGRKQGFEWAASVPSAVADRSEN